jgi:hypothetical protein
MPAKWLAVLVCCVFMASVTSIGRADDTQMTPAKKEQMNKIQERLRAVTGTIKGLQAQQTKLKNTAECLIGNMPVNTKINADDDDQVCVCCPDGGYSCCDPSPCEAVSAARTLVAKDHKGGLAKRNPLIYGVQPVAPSALALRAPVLAKLLGGRSK